MLIEIVCVYVFPGDVCGYIQFVCVCRSPGDVLETFNFLENAEDSDEDDDEEGDLMDDIRSNKHHRAKKHNSKVGMCGCVWLQKIKGTL